MVCFLCPLSYVESFWGSDHLLRYLYRLPITALNRPAALHWHWKSSALFPQIRTIGVKRIRRGMQPAFTFTTCWLPLRRQQDQTKKHRRERVKTKTANFLV